MTRVIGGLYLAPIDTEKVDRILDIGTGTGICKIIIIDISAAPRHKSLMILGATSIGDEIPNATVGGYYLIVFLLNAR